MTDTSKEARALDLSQVPFEPYYQDEHCVIYNADCRKVLPFLPKFDLLLTDLPYGMTANEWDREPDLPEFWSLVWRCTDLAVLTGSQPFTSKLVASQLSRFKHEWIWEKDRGSNFANTVREPFKEHESVLVFASKAWTYNPIRQRRSEKGLSRVQHSISEKAGSTNYRQFERDGRVMREDDRVPSSIQFFKRETGIHPTQKPVRLFEYMMQTYTNDGDSVLDCYGGSLTTAVAAKNLGRFAVCIEASEAYCEKGVKRLEQGVLF